MLALDSIAKRYGLRPSELIGETDEFKAMSIDLWAHNYGLQNEARIAWRGRRGVGSG